MLTFEKLCGRIKFKNIYINEKSIPLLFFLSVPWPPSVVEERSSPQPPSPRHYDTVLLHCVTLCRCTASRMSRWLGCGVTARTRKKSRRCVPVLSQELALVLQLLANLFRAPGCRLYVIGTTFKVSQCNNENVILS